MGLATLPRRLPNVFDACFSAAPGDAQSASRGELVTPELARSIAADAVKAAGIRESADDAERAGRGREEEAVHD